MFPTRHCIFINSVNKFRLDETKQLERSQSLCSSADTQDMLLEIYLNLQCSDAIHGNY